MERVLELLCLDLVESQTRRLRKRIAFTVAPVDKPGKQQCLEALTASVMLLWIFIQQNGFLFKA